MGNFATDGAANFDNDAIKTHIGVIYEGHNNMRAHLNTQSETISELDTRLTAVENASGNGNETTSLVYCHVDGGDYGNQSAPGAIVDAHYGNQLVPFTYIVEDPNGIYNSSNGRFTPGVDGVYKVTAVVNVFFANEKGRVVSATLHKNNTLPNPTGSASTRIATGVQQHNNTYLEYAGYHMHAYVDWFGSLTSTDYLQLYFFAQNAFNDRPYVDKQTKFIIYKIG